MYSFSSRKYDIDDKILRKRLDKIAVVERKANTFYCIVIDGKKNKYKDLSNSASFLARNNIEYGDSK